MRATLDAVYRICGAVAALLTNCSIEVERTGDRPPNASGDTPEEKKESEPILLPGPTE